jgi:hypothetical protein
MPEQVSRTSSAAGGGGGAGGGGPTARAARINLEDFVEASTRAVLRALASEGEDVSLNPQPLPPGGNQALVGERHGPIIIGIVANARFLR